MSILGSEALAVLNPLSCRRRSKKVVCTQAGRAFTVNIGSHGLLLMAPRSYNILKEIGGQSLEDRCASS